MSSFSFTITEDNDCRTIIREWSEVPSHIEIAYEERHGVKGWVEVSSVGPFSVDDVETMIKRLRFVKDILEEDDES